MTKEEMYDYLIDVVGVSQETMSVATCIKGFTKNTMEAVLYAVTGYWDFDQFQEDLNEEED